MVNAKEMALAAAKALDSKKGRDIKVLEIDKITTLADYFVICSGGSNWTTAAWRSMCSTRRPARSMGWSVCGATATRWTSPAC